ncbi:MAG: mannose-1-phosphate guanylyltransferase [Bacillota bacterium]|nr:mannose-1-phosphate guanylyltransferase [Bacillota bacterium]
MISVILAGGKGLRLWPESRQAHPKQLCKFINNRSMLDHTIDRLMEANSERIIIITSDDLLPSIQSLVQTRSDGDLIEVLSEPEGKNTAPAVGLALTRFFPTEKDTVFGIFPADHHVLDVNSFKQSVAQAVAAAEHDHIVTIGIKPDRPETGYGYIEKSKWEIGEIPDVYQVNSFCEKPDVSTAESYLSSGQHMWNSGIYIGKAQTLMDEFSSYLPEIYSHLSQGYDHYIQSYNVLPSISLDYGIAEKSKRMAVVPGAFGWCDLGSWNALSELFDNDEDNNTCTGNDIVALESKNCVVKQKDKSIVLFGVENLLVVETDNIVLISDRERTQDIRTVVDLLQTRNREDLL